MSSIGSSRSLRMLHNYSCAARHYPSVSICLALVLLHASCLYAVCCILAIFLDLLFICVLMHLFEVCIYSLKL